LQLYAAQYTCQLRTPVHRLAPELLLEIADHLEELGLDHFVQGFQHDRDTPLARGSSRAAAVKPFLKSMAQTCRAWRSLVIPNRQMWCKHLCFGGHKMEEAHYEYLQEELEDAHSSDLFVRFGHQTLGSEYANAAMEILLKHVGQIRSLYVIAPQKNQYSILEAFYSQLKSMTRLGHLTIVNGTYLARPIRDAENTFPLLPQLLHLDLSEIAIPKIPSTHFTNYLHLSNVRLSGEVEQSDCLRQICRASRRLTLDNVIFPQAKESPPTVSLDNSMAVTKHVIIMGRQDQICALLHVLDLRIIESLKLSLGGIDDLHHTPAPRWFSPPELRQLTFLEVEARSDTLHFLINLLRVCKLPRLRRLRITLTRVREWLGFGQPSTHGEYPIWVKLNFEYSFDGTESVLGFLPDDCSQDTPMRRTLGLLMDSPFLMQVEGQVIPMRDDGAPCFPSASDLQKLPIKQLEFLVDYTRKRRDNQVRIEQINFIKMVHLQRLDLTDLIWEEQREEAWKEVWQTLAPSLVELQALGINVPKRAENLEFCIEACRSIRSLRYTVQHKSPAAALKFLTAEPRGRPWLPFLQTFEVRLNCTKLGSKWTDNAAALFAECLQADVEERERLGLPLRRLGIIQSGSSEVSLMHHFGWFRNPAKGFDLFPVCDELYLPCYLS
jgi:hypothetical protein